MADETLIQAEGTAPESSQPADETTPTPAGEEFGDELNLDKPAEAEPESAPSGGDGTPGTEPPAAEPAVDTPAEAAPESGEGESATAPEGEAVTPSDSIPEQGEPTQSAGDEASASPEPGADSAEATPAEPSAAPDALTSEPLAAGPGGPGVPDAEGAQQEEGLSPAPDATDAPSQESAQTPSDEPTPAAGEPASGTATEASSAETAAEQKADEQDKPPAQVAWEEQNATSSLPPPESSDCISDGSIPQASGNDAPTSTPVAGGEQVMGPIPETPASATQADTSTTATPSPDETPKPEETSAAPAAAPTGDPATIYGGQAHPSPLPQIADKDLLPHPALADQSPGFISGTTQGTQGAIPVPGPADSAAATAAVLSGTASGAGEAEGAAAGASAEATEAKASDAGSAGAEATAALPVAPQVQETFKTLSEDGKAVVEALKKVQEDIGEVIALEFKTLANVAAHIAKRLEDTKGKLDEPEQRTKLVSVANRVLELLDSLGGFFGEDAADAPLPPDVEKVIASLGELGESARKSLYA